MGFFDFLKRKKKEKKKILSSHLYHLRIVGAVTAGVPHQIVMMIMMTG